MEAYTLKETSWGIAYSYGNIIELNPILKNYPKLYNYVLNHEKGHIKLGNSKGIHFLYDLKESFSLMGEKMNFALRHPIIYFEQLMPIWFQNGELNYNSFGIMMSASILALLGADFMMLRSLI